MMAQADAERIYSLVRPRHDSLVNSQGLREWLTVAAACRLGFVRLYDYARKVA